MKRKDVVGCLCANGEQVVSVCHFEDSECKCFFVCTGSEYENDIDTEKSRGIFMILVTHNVRSFLWKNMHTQEREAERTNIDLNTV